MKLSQEELELKAKQLKLEYMRAYRKSHKEEFKGYREKYWEKRALENS